MTEENPFDTIKRLKTAVAMLEMENQALRNDMVWYQQLKMNVDNQGYEGKLYP